MERKKNIVPDTISKCRSSVTRARMKTWNPGNRGTNTEESFKKISKMTFVQKV